MNHASFELCPCVLVDTLLCPYLKLKLGIAPLQIAMLQHGGGQSYAVGKKRSRADGGDCEAKVVPRPSKVRAMLAMRACRGSIMIGTALSHGQMQQTVARLADLDSPWNCPHGRPTMRHICSVLQKAAPP
jgi:hypothetical protein